MAKKSFRAMVVSVGGTPAPVLFSLNRSKPEYICFLVSRQTKKLLEEEILPKLDFKPRNYYWIVNPNADLLSACYWHLTRKFAWTTLAELRRCRRHWFWQRLRGLVAIAMLAEMNAPKVVSES